MAVKILTAHKILWLKFGILILHGRILVSLRSLTLVSKTYIPSVLCVISFFFKTDVTYVLLTIDVLCKENATVSAA